MSLFQFIKSKTFLKHILIALASLFLLFWILLKFLSSYTHHGETIKVPDFTGLRVGELDKFIADKQLHYLVIDSIYDIKSKKGIVIRQDPEPNIPVKQNRTIYLYSTAMMPPRVKMPKLKDRSLRQAKAMLETYGLRVGSKIEYRPDQCANCVLKQLIKGKIVEPGTLIEKGSVIDLVVGKGLGDEQVPVPNLIGLTRNQARDKLSESSLNEGASSYDQPADSTKARVFKQLPKYSKHSSVNMGSSIDLFYTNSADKIPAIADTSASNDVE